MFTSSTLFISYFISDPKFFCENVLDPLEIFDIVAWIVSVNLECRYSTFSNSRNKSTAELSNIARKVPIALNTLFRHIVEIES